VLRADLETLNERVRGLGFANKIMRYLMQGKGMITFGALLCAASVRILPGSATPDVQCVFAPVSYKPGLIRKFDDRPAILGKCGRCRAAMRWSVRRPTRLRSTHATFARTPISARWSVASGSYGARWPQPLATHIIEKNVPGPSVQSDNELLDYARSNASTV
jgi:choline dehydrogenase